MKTHFDDTEELKDVALSRENALTAKYVRAALRISIQDLTITTTIENGNFERKPEQP